MTLEKYSGTAKLGRMIASASVALLAVSCAATESRPEMPDLQFADCPVQGSRDWKAWVDAMPGPDRGRTLHIVGEVDLPTPGYAAALAPGPADRAMPPSQRFSLILTPPQGPVTQVITPTQVRYDGEATYQAYRSITIGCAGDVIAEISDVQTAY